MPEPAHPVAPAGVRRDSGGETRGSFADRLTALVDRRESQIVLGLDPDPMQLWPIASGHAQETPGHAQPLSHAEPSSHAQEPPGYADEPSLRAVKSSGEASPAARAAAAMRAHCLALIDAAGPACVAVKPQLARFEVLGAPGWAALEEVVAYAHAAGLLVIADCKRGDIAETARAYAQAMTGVTATPFGDVRGLGADMLTVNPLMGADAIEPFIATARRVGSGVLALVRTSNPGAADVEDLELAGGGRVWERLAALVNRLGREGVGESGLSDVGAVVGATAPEHLARARELMPRAVFLLPGVGAQGGRVEELAPAFLPGRAGGLVAASRSIANAHVLRGEDPAAAARAEAERLRELAWQIS